MVVDLEATCFEDKAVQRAMGQEVIELPAVLLDAKTLLQVDSIQVSPDTLGQKKGRQPAPITRFIC